MQLRTQHFLQVDVVIVVLIIAFLLVLGRLAAETNGASRLLKKSGALGLEYCVVSIVEG